MPQIKPNSAIVVATVTHIEIYSKQSDFSILSLKVKSATAKADEDFLFDKGSNDMKALISNNELHVKENNIITVEVKKVSIDLWRIIRFISK